MSYLNLQQIKNMDFKDKSVLVVGAGWMAEQHWCALKALKVSRVCVISKTESSAKRCNEKTGFEAYSGGYDKCLPQLGVFDLVIIATPIDVLKPAAKTAMSIGNKNILIEKPGALYSQSLEDWITEVDENIFRVRIAYNRLTYQNLWKLKDLIEEEGGINSCRYTFTEWTHAINFEKSKKEVYERWGISNSLHVICMAHSLIGLPKKLFPIQAGSLSWHIAGSRFIGAGLSESNIPFTYHSDWESPGRWSIEIMTQKNAYRLMPLEKLYCCPKGSIDWHEIETSSDSLSVKEGVAEEVAIMLHRELEKCVPLVTLYDAYNYTALAEQIFGYPAKPTI